MAFGRRLRAVSDSVSIVSTRCVLMMTPLLLRVVMYAQLRPGVKYDRLLMGAQVVGGE